MAGSDDDDTKEIQPQELDTRELAAARASRRRRGVPLQITVALFVVAFLIGHQSGKTGGANRLGIRRARDMRFFDP